ncbi:putative thioredoxin reductase [Prochlorococcus marinus str. MIT 9515]|uniref:Thioredoxin reductase n=1 Tax=Prochlorococcus marinus (strain MIT 9515) TaxID=167542 RepID=A2BXL1_PROM5|nr:thioredoxin-disulfide reductase [Prochlorococcus marinus]ABM72522.1 putative thioredoxin reductase [Prochlorococcus marinus str. MIT 9515]
MEMIKKEENIENLVIIGSGPAGYTAAIYAARANLQPLLVTGFNSGGIPGGQLMTTTFVENFPGFPDGVLGPELMDLMKAQAERWGTNLYESDVISIDTSKRPFELKTLEGIIKTNSIIIATGASANRLGVINEDKFWSKGISACAICDGATPQFRNEELAVIGGGDSACEEAAYLTKYGSKVHLLVRSEKLRASAAMIDRVKGNSKIEIHWNTKVEKAIGTDWLDKIEAINTEKGYVEIKVKGLFYAIGHTPNTKFLDNKIELDKKGYIACKSGRPETSIDGIYAAGDVVDSEWRQGVTAAGTGCMAALAAERWLAEKNLSKIIIREKAEPEKTLPSSSFNEEETDENTFDLNSKWQKGSYALRKLYHESNKPILVIFSSPSCGPCHVLKPQLKRVINEFDGAVQGIEIDIDKDQEIAKQAGINGTPTIQLFKEKLLKKQWQGVKQRSEFKEAIQNII